MKFNFLCFLVCYGSATQAEPCECISTHGFALKCHCEGNISSVKEKLQNGYLYSLSVSDADMVKLHNTLLNDYKHSLVELTITSSNSLQAIESEVFRGMTNLRHLRITHTSLVELPGFVQLGDKGSMHIIDLESNKIERIKSNSAKVRTEQLFLDYNKIRSIDGWAFNGSEIARLSLRGNIELTELSSDAFNGIYSLRDLDLSDTSITFLPPLGLDKLEILRLTNTFTLKVIPSIYDLSTLQKAWLTYSFHCCAFHNPEKHNPQRHQKYLQLKKELCTTETTRWKRNINGGFGAIVETTSQDSKDQYSDLALNYNETISDETFHQMYTDIPKDKIDALCGNLTARYVSCFPKPDALNPCEDMMSWLWLRVSIWFVISAGIIGNVAVLVVLCLSKTEKSVPRFLMCNLAFADLIMAAYLLMLAIMDMISSETYFNYAYDWQRGYGCKMAGFLTVFASQLSLFTLSLLTIERWFAIRHALHLNLLDLRITSHIMVAGWIYSIIMALLPLIGVSSYSSTSICLPMDSENYISQVYIITMIVVAGCAFLLMCVCYTQIYLSLSYETRHSISEGAIVRKMTILVGTNFLCWAPVAFFSFTALAGHPLITISQSKILLVFIYPINSCANPYLYAILTKQYRKDCLSILSRHFFYKRSSHRNMGYSRPTSNEVPGQQTTAETLL
ncbi:follicle-stimulating hormone receptor [Halyomorpha halys]|uniref:follicle-stimulating hormone receptor n=1 Tax=Halyomorpha halys TaxID=286706 RepID=UPI0006D51525|nr:follicle-stimulating hormone receptor-like [Halyomorpha halys]